LKNRIITEWRRERAETITRSSMGTPIICMEI